MEPARLTRREIRRLVYNWIGVDGGYLGAFSYNSHDRFWLENCDLPVDTGSFAGTTRACFEETLYQAKARDQASALRTILEDYPVNRMVGAIATILDALNPVRNNASVAHPNDQLVGEPEAHLVINIVRTLLNYLEDKRRRWHH